MGSPTESTSLDGKVLIASPGMEDPRFAGAVILICAHSEDGAMGLIVNKPTPEIELDNLLDQLHIPAVPGHRRIRVHFGGPVETGRGFVLHSPDYAGGEGTLRINDAFQMTASLEILQAIGQGRGPDEAVLMLGYAGWGPGQLEHEIALNGWLIADGDPSIIFRKAPADIWQAALRSIGIDPVMLSSQGGRA